MSFKNISANQTAMAKVMADIANHCGDSSCVDILNAINDKIPDLGQANLANSVPVALPSDQDFATDTTLETTNTQLTTISGQLPASLGQKTTATSLAVALPSDQDFATNTTLGTVNTSVGTSNTRLTTISGQLPASLGQKTMATSLAVALPSDQDFATNTTLGTVNTSVGTSNTRLTTISGQLPASLGQKTTATSLAVALPSDQDFATNTTLGTVNTSVGTSNTRLTTISGQLPASLGQKTTATSLAVALPSTQAPLYDVFGRMMIGQSKIMFASTLRSSYLADIQFDTLATGSGTATYNSTEASYTLTVTTAVGSIIKQTYQRFQYIPSKAQTIYISAILGNQESEVVSRLGYYDTDNGMYIQSSGGVISVGIRSDTSGDPVDTTVEQANWNMDTLDGNGPSGVTINFATTQIFVFTYQWFGVGTVKFGIFINSSVTYFHEIQHTNQMTTVYMRTANLPIRYEISTTGGNASTATMTQICAAVVNENGELFTYTNRIIYSLTALTINNTSNWHPLITVRLRDNTLDSIVKIVELSLLCTTNTDYAWKLTIDPTFTTTITYTASDTSTVEYSINTANNLYISGGTDIAYRLVASDTDASSFALNFLENSLFTLGSKIDGTPIPVCFAVYSISNQNETFYSSLSYFEEL